MASDPEQIWLLLVHSSEHDESCSEKFWREKKKMSTRTLIMCSCVQNNLIGNYWFWWIYFSWITQPSSVCDSYTALKRPSDMYIYMYWMCLWYLDWLVQFSSAGLNGGLYKNNGIARPQHRELYSLLFVRSMWSAVQRRGRGQGLPLIILIQEVL